MVANNLTGRDIRASPLDFTPAGSSVGRCVDPGAPQRVLSLSNAVCDVNDDLTAAVLEVSRPV